MTPRNSVMECATQRLPERASIATVEDKERWLAAIHESAHAVLFARFGGVGIAEIWRNPVDHPEHRTWLGAFGMFGFADEMTDQFGWLQRPVNWACLVGMAGRVAELMIEEELTADDVVAVFLDDAENLSPTDAGMIDDGLLEENVWETFEWICRLWPMIERKAGDLERDAIDFPSTAPRQLR